MHLVDLVFREFIVKNSPNVAKIQAPKHSGVEELVIVQFQLYSRVLFGLVVCDERINGPIVEFKKSLFSCFNRLFFCDQFSWNIKAFQR